MLIISLLLGKFSYGQKVSDYIYRIKSVPLKYISGTNADVKDINFKSILKLDSDAVPDLIKLITDTTITPVYNQLEGRYFKIGDVAFCLLEEINGRTTFWSMITGGQFCLIGPDYTSIGAWGYINSNRENFSKQYAAFYHSREGKMYRAILKGKYKKTKIPKALDEIIKYKYN